MTTRQQLEDLIRSIVDDWESPMIPELPYLDEKSWQLVDAIAAAILAAHPYLEWPCVSSWETISAEKSSIEFNPEHFYIDDDRCANCGQPKPEVKDEK